VIDRKALTTAVVAVLSLAEGGTEAEETRDFCSKQCEWTPSDSVSDQCTRQIETDTVLFGGSCIFSDTVQFSGFRPCASLTAYNRFASSLAKKTTPHTS